MPNLTNSLEPEPGFFWPLRAGAARKKYHELDPEPLGKKIRSLSRSQLKKKSGAGAGAAKKFAGSPALVLTVLKPRNSVRGTGRLKSRNAVTGTLREDSTLLKSSNSAKSKGRF